MCKAKILSTLKGRVNFVSAFCATAGVDNGASELAELVRDGKVERKMVRHFADRADGGVLLPMYRAYPNASKLTLVK